jgi:hypothetical protein
MLEFTPPTILLTVAIVFFVTTTLAGGTWSMQATKDTLR